MSRLLVKQLAHELKNFNLYKTFANYFTVEGLMDLAEYYEKRAGEEMKHHDWIYNYLTEADIKFEYPEIAPNNIKPKSILEPFQLTVDREIETTNMLYMIYEAALAEKDYMTSIWLQSPLLSEQVEEENTSRAALIIMEENADIFVKADKVLDLLEG